MTGRPVLLRTSILRIDPDPSILTRMKAPRGIGYDYLNVNTVKQRDGRVEFRLCLEPVHCSANDMCVILCKSLSSVPWVFYLSSNIPNSYYALWNSLTPVQERHDVESCHSFSTSMTLSSLPIQEGTASTKCRKEWRVWSKFNPDSFSWCWELGKAVSSERCKNRLFLFKEILIFASILVQSH